MSREPSLDAERLLRRLADQPLPVGPDDAAPERRERLVRGMKAAVERAFERAHGARRYRRVAFALAAAAAVSVLVVALSASRFRTDAVAAVAGVSGTVVLTQDGARHVVGAFERGLRHGDSLQTAAGAQARVKTSKSSVQLGESTELELLMPSAAEERIGLRRGRLEVSVDKAVDAQRVVVVETPDAEVVVRGTVFDVSVEPASSATTTHVHVRRGSVWVLARGAQAALLSAGQSWSSGGAARAQPPAAQPGTAAAPEQRVAPLGKAGRAPLGKPAAARKAGTLAEENRLFAAAIEARNRGEAGRAAELFGELLSTYPRSALRESAQVERFRSLSRAGQTARAAGEARRYLAEHADGFARSEARDLALQSK